MKPADFDHSPRAEFPRFGRDRRIAPKAIFRWVADHAGQVFLSNFAPFELWLKDSCERRGACEYGDAGGVRASAGGGAKTAGGETEAAGGDPKTAGGTTKVPVATG